MSDDAIEVLGAGAEVEYLLAVALAVAQQSPDGRAGLGPYHPLTAPTSPVAVGE